MKWMDAFNTVLREKHPTYWGGMYEQYTGDFPPEAFAQKINAWDDKVVNDVAAAMQGVNLQVMLIEEGLLIVDDLLLDKMTP